MRTRPDVLLCCGVLWGLSLGCASSSATVREAAPGMEAAAPPMTGSSARPSAAPVEAAVQQPSGYGYTPEEPIKVGGGPQGEREYLQFLRGPEGQETSFKRIGSCCGFEDDSLPFGVGMLDRYEVSHDGLSAPVTLYLDMYHRESPRPPAGFRLD